MHALYDEARPLLMQALDLEPRQIYAADMVTTAAPFLGDRAGDERARAVLRQFGDPDGNFLHDLNQLLPKWGGSEAAMRQFCRQESSLVETISEAECNALVTLDLPGVSIAAIDAAISTLAGQGEDHWIKRRARALMRIHRPREALALFERHDTWISWSDVEDLAQALGDPALLKRVSQRWLAINP